MAPSKLSDQLTTRSVGRLYSSSTKQSPAPRCHIGSGGAAAHVSACAFGRSTCRDSPANDWRPCLSPCCTAESSRRCSAMGTRAFTNHVQQHWRVAARQAGCNPRGLVASQPHSTFTWKTFGWGLTCVPGVQPQDLRTAIRSIRVARPADCRWRAWCQARKHNRGAESLCW